MNRLVTLPALLAVLVAGLSLAALAGPNSASADCAALPSSLGTTSLTLNVQTAGTYKVWVRELAPAADSGGFYLQIPDAGVCQVTMGNSSIDANAWTWVNYQNGETGSSVSANLPAGNHAVTLSGLKSGVEVDRLLLLSDAACIPTGDGSNCSAAAATSVTPAPGSANTPGSANAGPGTSIVNTKSASPVANFFAAAGRFRNPLLFAGLLIIAIPALWFLAQHLGLIHPTLKPAGLDLPGQPNPKSIKPLSDTEAPAETYTIKPDHPAAAEPKPPKPVKPNLPPLPDTPPAPKPGSTTNPATNKD
jgi:hypothetical protein